MRRCKLLHRLPTGLLVEPISSVGSRQLFAMRWYRRAGALARHQRGRVLEIGRKQRGIDGAKPFGSSSVHERD